MPATDQSTPESRARKRAKDVTGLMMHAAIYLAVNAFLWIMDIVQGDGIGWAYWTTIGWGIGLVIHAVAFMLERGFEQRKYEQYLAEELRREQQAG